MYNDITGNIFYQDKFMVEYKIPNIQKTFESRMHISSVINTDLKNIVRNIFLEYVSGIEIIDIRKI